MSHTRREARAYLESSRPAIDELTRMIVERQTTLTEVAGRLARLEQTEEVLRDHFLQHQNSPKANYYYARFMEEMARIREQKKTVDTPIKQEQLAQKLVAELGATEESLGVLAGAILQLAKQTLSFRFGPKPTLARARLVGTQSIVDVIWDGRNQALHWEEANPRLAVRSMLTTLEQDFSLSLPVGQNHALTILGVLGWRTSAEVFADLRRLVLTQP